MLDLRHNYLYENSINHPPKSSVLVGLKSERQQQLSSLVLLQNYHLQNPNNVTSLNVTTEIKECVKIISEIVLENNNSDQQKRRMSTQTYSPLIASLAYKDQELQSLESSLPEMKTDLRHDY
jgi:hypothetical protein